MVQKWIQKYNKAKIEPNQKELQLDNEIPQQKQIVDENSLKLDDYPA